MDTLRGQIEDLSSNISADVDTAESLALKREWERAGRYVSDAQDLLRDFDRLIAGQLAIAEAAEANEKFTPASEQANDKGLSRMLADVMQADGGGS